MSILIKGVEMPKSCNECPFGKEKQFDFGIVCTLLNGTTLDVTSRPKGICPLVPVPPHGRLIDADELYDSMMMAMVMTGYQVRALIEIDFAPTIVPADKDNNVLCKKEGE